MPVPASHYEKLNNDESFDRKIVETFKNFSENFADVCREKGSFYLDLCFSFQHVLGQDSKILKTGFFSALGFRSWTE